MNPSGALDPMIRTELQTDLQGIFQELGKTVVLVTHDLGEAAFFGDVIVLLRGDKSCKRARCQNFFKPRPNLSSPTS